MHRRRDSSFIPRRSACLAFHAFVLATLACVSTASAATFEARTAASADDAEEAVATAAVNLTSSDLELIQDGSTNQIVGMRWTALTIPRSATITAAYIQFSAKESQSTTTNLTLQGQAADNALAFTTATGNISARARTAAGVSWAPVAWNAGEIGPNQRTPDLRSVIQEVVNRSGWVSGR